MAGRRSPKWDRRNALSKSSFESEEVSAVGNDQDLRNGWRRCGCHSLQEVPAEQIAGPIEEIRALGRAWPRESGVAGRQRLHLQR
jgi:hypothetical protein